MEFNSHLDEKTAHQSTRSTNAPKSYDYILVLDFEATCENKTKLIPQVNIVY